MATTDENRKRAHELEKQGVKLLRSTWTMSNGTVGKTEVKNPKGLAWNNMFAHLEHHDYFCEKFGHGSYHHLEIEFEITP